MYTGDSANYLNNHLCQSTPALQRDDPVTYYEDERAYNYDKDPFGKGRGMVHKNGVEIGCDLVGKYVHIVIDMGREIGNNYQIEICSLAVLSYCDGDCDVYRRDDKLPESFEVEQDVFEIMSV